MGRDAVLLRQYPGDTTALLGDESLSKRPPSLLFPTGEGVPELAGPPGQKHPSSPVINHLAPDSSSSIGVKRSHLGWSRWRLQRKTFTNECLLSCIIIYSITQAREGLRMQKAQSLCLVFLCSYTVRCPLLWKSCTALR